MSELRKGTANYRQKIDAFMKQFREKYGWGTWLGFYLNTHGGRDDEVLKSAEYQAWAGEGLPEKPQKAKPKETAPATPEAVKPPETVTPQALAPTTSAAELDALMTEPKPWYWNMMTPDQQRAYLENMLNQGTRISPSDRLQEALSLQQMQAQREQFELSRQLTAYQQAEMERWRRLDELAERQYSASLNARPYSWIERFMSQNPKGIPPAPSFLPKFAPGEAAGQPLKGTGLQTPNVFTALNTPQVQSEMLEGYADYIGDKPWSVYIQEALSRQGYGNAPRGRSY